MTGICITIYNRPDYLLQCLDSLSKADLTDCKVLLVNDCSTDDRIKDILRKQDLPVWTTQKRSMVYGALLEGFKHLSDCETLMVLDSDAIVKPDFVSKSLQLLSKFPTHIITGFNCVTKDKDGRERHRITDQGEGWNKKHSVGGIHMVFSRETYEKHVKPELLNCVKRRGQWDMNLCKRMGGAYSTVPSVIQHIGLYSSMGHMHDVPDVAEDFGEVETTVTHKRTFDLLVVNQFQGIGDVIFCMHLVKRLSDGARILWPVYGPYVEGLNKAYPDVTFIDAGIYKINYESREDYQKDGIRVIPLRFADQIMRVPFKDCMRSKYDMYGMDWTEWVNERPVFSEKGKELAELLSAEGEYTLVNTKFRTAQNGNIQVQATGKVIEMRNVPGFSLFDWWYVIQNASEIHTVSTSIIYIFELLNSLNSVPKIYIRVPDEKNHDNYQYIMTRHKYEFMENKIPDSGMVKVQAIQNYNDLQLKTNIRVGNTFVCSVERAQVLVDRGRVVVIGVEPIEIGKQEVSHVKKMKY